MGDFRTRNVVVCTGQTFHFRYELASVEVIDLSTFEIIRTVSGKHRRVLCSILETLDAESADSPEFRQSCNKIWGPPHLRSQRIQYSDGVIVLRFRGYDWSAYFTIRQQSLEVPSTRCRKGNILTVRPQ